MSDQQPPSEELLPCPRIKFLFAWYDCWIGFFWDKKKYRLYVFPVPMLGFYLQMNTRPTQQTEDGEGS